MSEASETRTSPGISLAPKTVKNYLRSAMSKLGAKDRKQAAEGFGHAVNVAAFVSQDGGAMNEDAGNANNSGTC